MYVSSVCVLLDKDQHYIGAKRTNVFFLLGALYGGFFQSKSTPRGAKHLRVKQKQSVSAVQRVRVCGCVYVSWRE